jgi:Fe-S cluster assembly protein SufD
MSSLTAEKGQAPEAEILESHKKFIEDKGTSCKFSFLNEVGASQFEKLGFPGRKHEMFTFVNTNAVVSNFSSPSVTEIDKDQISGFVYPGCEKSFLVLVDGKYREDLSETSGIEDSIKLVSGGDALDDPEVREYVESSTKTENDVFASINSAFRYDGLFLDVSPKAIMKSPIQILVISGGSKDKTESSRPWILARVGDLAEAKIIVRYAGLNGNYFVNSVQDYLVGNGAGLELAHIETDKKDARNFSKTRLVLNRDSRFNGSNVSYGTALTRCHLDVRLKSPGAEFRLNSVSVLEKSEQVHNYMRVYHEAPQCASAMHFKNIVNDQSRSSVDGTVIVERDAQLTNSDQLINSLALSDGAHADSKPNLIINANDVKCTHGNTVGQIDEEQLFYLKARGLSESIAKTLLTKSFAASIVDTIAFPNVRKDVENTLLRKLEENDD